MEERTYNTPEDLRVGYIGRLLFDRVLGQTTPRQIDLLDLFFPRLLIEEVTPPGKQTESQRQDASFDDLCDIIRAMKIKGKFHVGKSNRVTQIVGRLIGTAKSNLEKERKTASLIQENLAGRLVNQPNLTIHLVNNTELLLSQLTDEQWVLYIDSFADYINTLMKARAQMTDLDKNWQLFPINDEVFDELMGNVVAQWNLFTLRGFSKALTWLLLGALLRNQIVRLLYYYDTDFSLLREVIDPDMLEAGDYEDYYGGDDLDRRFPGIEWYCDRCGDYLNSQEGFDDHVRIWTCSKCGYKNPITIDHIYETKEDYLSGQSPVNPDKFFQALKERGLELEARPSSPREKLKNKPQTEE